MQPYDAARTTANHGFVCVIYVSDHAARDDFSLPSLSQGEPRWLLLRRACHAERVGVASKDSVESTVLQFPRG